MCLEYNYNSIYLYIYNSIILEIHFFILLKIILIDYYVDRMCNFTNFCIIKDTIIYEFIFNASSFEIKV